MAVTELMVPLLVIGVCAFAAAKGTDVFSAMCRGAKKGLEVAAGILPALVILLAAVSMLRSSGAPEILAKLLQPLFSLFGIPAETAVLMLIRPFSGSGALAAGSDIIAAHGADSFVGRCAAVMLGSTETTFYVAAVYFGAAGIKKTRHAVPSALAADLAGFIAAAFTVRLFF